MNAANVNKAPQGIPDYIIEWPIPPYSERPRGKCAVLGESLRYQRYVDWDEPLVFGKGHRYIVDGDEPIALMGDDILQSIFGRI